MIENAINYMKEHISYSDDSINRMICDSMEQRIPVGMLYPSLKDEIEDLLDDFSQDNDLDEEWWSINYDIDTITEML